MRRQLKSFFVWLIIISALFLSPSYVMATASWTLSNYNSSLYRERHSSTLLPSGKLLVAGTPLSSAGTEKYDPDAIGNPWSSAGSMHYGRFLHTADLVPYNEENEMGVVVTGGYGKKTGSLTYLKSTELFVEPNNWTEKSDMNVARQQHASAVIGGKILVAGGYNGFYGGGILDSVEIYDPIADTWTLANENMDEPRVGAKAVAIDGDDRVLVAGGANSSGALLTTEIYDVASDAWESGPELGHSKVGGTLTLLPNGKVLVAGEGYSQMFDPSDDSLSDEVEMVNYRKYHASSLVTLADDSQAVLAAGGYGGGQTAELYDIANDSWSATESMNYSRAYPTANTVGDGTEVVVIGAQYGQTQARKAEVFTDN